MFVLLKTKLRNFCPIPSTYSPLNNAFGVIRLILSDIIQIITKVKMINPTPNTIINPTGISNIHFTIPTLLKNKDANGFIR